MANAKPGTTLFFVNVWCPICGVSKRSDHYLCSIVEGISCILHLVLAWWAVFIFIHRKGSNVGKSHTSHDTQIRSDRSWAGAVVRKEHRYRLPMRAYRRCNQGGQPTESCVWLCANMWWRWSSADHSRQKIALADIASTISVQNSSPTPAMSAALSPTIPDIKLSGAENFHYTVECKCRWQWTCALARWQQGAGFVLVRK